MGGSVHLSFVPLNNKTIRRLVFVISNVEGGVVGTIEYSKLWKQYTFTPIKVEFSRIDLREIANYLSRLSNQQLERRS